MADKLSVLIGVVVRTGENDVKTISVDANPFENGAKPLRFRLKTDGFENGLVWTGPHICSDIYLWMLSFPRSSQFPSPFLPENYLLLDTENVGEQISGIISRQTDAFNYIRINESSGPG